MVLFKGYAQGTFTLNGRQHELAPAVESPQRRDFVRDYVLFDVAQTAATNTFSCAVADQEREIQRLSSLEQRSLVPQCVEIGLDIDNFTYNTFADCYGAIDWALGVLAGVDLVYRTELNDFITLQASYVNVWEVPEPWAGTVNDAGTMLDQLRLEWNADNPVLAGANWDMVHLMSKRGDTGTGGIAYLGVVCDANFACGFRAPWTTNRIFQSSLPTSRGTCSSSHTSLATTLAPTTPTGADGQEGLTTPTSPLDRLAPSTIASTRKADASSPSSTNKAPS